MRRCVVRSCSSLNSLSSRSSPSASAGKGIHRTCVYMYEVYICTNEHGFNRPMYSVPSFCCNIVSRLCQQRNLSYSCIYALFLHIRNTSSASSYSFPCFNFQHDYICYICNSAENHIANIEANISLFSSITSLNVGHFDR